VNVYKSEKQCKVENLYERATKTPVKKGERGMGRRIYNILLG